MAKKGKMRIMGVSYVELSMIAKYFASIPVCLETAKAASSHSLVMFRDDHP